MRRLLSRLRPASGARFDVVGLGECSLDEVWRLQEDGRFSDFSTAGGKQNARSRDVLGGGQVATAMVACRRLGLRAAFLGTTGGDEAGRLVVQGLRDEGVDVTGVRVVETARTRCALVLVDGVGERSVLELHDPGLTLRDGEPAPGEIIDARVLHVDATQLPAAILAATHARIHGTLVSIDVDQVVPGVEHLVALSDLCIVPRGFPQPFTGEADFERAVMALSRRTTGLVVVTLGAEGCVALDQDVIGAGAGDQRLLYCPAFPVMRAVDTTACGDTFHAAMIAALIYSHDHNFNQAGLRSDRPISPALPWALRFANAAAALKCRALGRRGCPTRAEVETLLSH